MADSALTDPSSESMRRDEAATRLQAVQRGRGVRIAELRKVEAEKKRKAAATRNSKTMMMAPTPKRNGRKLRKKKPTRSENSEVAQRQKELADFEAAKRAKVKNKFKKAKGMLKAKMDLLKHNEANALSKKLNVKYGRLCQMVAALCRTLDDIGEPNYDKYTIWLGSNTNIRNCAYWMVSLLS